MVPAVRSTFKVVHGTVAGGEVGKVSGLRRGRPVGHPDVFEKCKMYHVRVFQGGAMSHDLARLLYLPYLRYGRIKYGT